MSKQPLDICFIIVILLLISQRAYASGGAPLIVLFDFSGYLVGFLVIVFIESLVFSYYTNIKLPKSIKKITLVNIKSTLLIYVLFPVIISFFGIIGSFLPSNLGKLFLSLGTWVLDGFELNRLSLKITFFWLAISFILSVFLEYYYLKKIFHNRTINTKDVLKLSAIMNSASNFTSIIIIILFWKEIIFNN